MVSHTRHDSCHQLMLSLSVLIQPNLRFFHELFGWEVELAKREAEAAKSRREEAEKQGVRDPEALKLIEGETRKIVYSWPSFCRDLVSLFLSPVVNLEQD